MNFSMDQLIQESGKIPPIPQTVQKALKLIDDPESNATDLAVLLASDHVLAEHVLRWANSAYYGTGSQISTVQQAVVALGMDVIEELILTYSAFDHMARPLPGYKLQRGELWHHALGSAICARLISKQQHLQLDEEAYFAGLLCDIGKLVLEKHLREIDLKDSNWERQPFLEMERANFGVDHAMLGAEMARHWQLPEELATAIAYHHEPHHAQDHQILVATVHVGDISMKILGIGMGIDGLFYPPDEAALNLLNLTWEGLFRLADQVNEQLKHAKELIYFE